MARKRSSMAAIWLFVLVVGLMCSCGNGTAPGDQSGATNRDDGGTSSRHPLSNRAAGQSHREARNAVCTGARVSLGAERSAIEFAVKCEGKHSGSSVGFTLSRYSLHARQSRQGIRSIMRHPRLIGPGSKDGATASCKRLARGSRVRDGVYCQARALGVVTMIGRIKVRPSQRCSMGVLVTAALRSQCHSRVCPSSFESRTLARGRPEGC